MKNSEIRNLKSEMESPLKILHLEDDPLDAEFAIATLEAAGYECDAERVQTRADFLARLDDPDYDVVLADYSLPAFDGLTALRLFEEREINIPFILVSGSLGEEIVIQSLKSGADNYVLKDRIARLAPAVEKALEEQRLRIAEKQHHQAVRESEEKYRKLTENAIFGISVCKGTELIFANTKLLDMFMVDSVDRFNEKPPLYYLTPESKEKAKERMKKLSQGVEVPESFEVDIVRTDGEQRTLELSTTDITIDGEPCRLSSYNDITKRVQAEEALQKSKRDLQALISNSPVCTKIVDLDFNLQFMSASGVRELHIDDITEFYGKQYPLHFYPDSLKIPMRNNLRKAKATGEIITQEALTNDIDGNKLWYQSTIVPVNDNQGKLDYLMVVSLETTKRVQAEQALQESEERLDMALEGTRAGLWDWNVQTGETVFNERWAEIVGYELEELEPVSIETWEELAHPEDLERSNELLEKHFAGETDYYEFEGRMKHKNGDWVWILDRGRIVEWDDEGNPVRMVGTHIDITERVRVQEALRKSEEIFRNIFQSVPESLLAVDKQIEVLNSNKVFVELICKYAP